MTTSEFSKLFAEQYNVSAQAAETWIRSIIEFLAEQCVLNTEIKLTGFGAFKQKYSQPRKYLDLNSGTVKISEPKMNLGFDPSPKMEKAMRSAKIPEQPKFNKRNKSDLPIRVETLQDDGMIEIIEDPDTQLA